MAMKKFYVGVKAIIKEERGYLLLKHSKGHMDIPGGRMDEDEDFVDTIKRELSEELPGTELKVVGDLLGTFRLPKDIDGDISLVLLYFLVEAKVPTEIILSDEHESYVWVASVKDIPEGLNPGIDKIFRELFN